MGNDEGASCVADKIAFLKQMLRDRAKYMTNDFDPKRDTILRRIFALEHGINFVNPFGEVDETLFRIGGLQ